MSEKSDFERTNDVRPVSVKVCESSLLKSVKVCESLLKSVKGRLRSSVAFWKCILKAASFVTS